jgi:hypothetical protein
VDAATVDPAPTSSRPSSTVHLVAPLAETAEATEANDVPPRRRQVG